ncbi:MAG: MarC family protein [Spirochaetales bacterium]|nr:MarC family protein [Spirochaetales bacterium]
MIISIRQILVFQIALFSMFSPFSVIAPFVNLTMDYSRKIQHRMAFRVALFSMLTLLVTAWVGDVLLKFLGISLEALAAAGGTILAAVSIPMVLKGDSPRKKVDLDTLDETSEDWKSIVVTPLVFPLTIGAGSISLVLTQVGHAEGFPDRLIISSVILMHGVVMWLTYYFAGPVSRKIGRQGNAVITRIGGIILLSIAYELLATGLTGLLPGLAG